MDENRDNINEFKYIGGTKQYLGLFHGHYHHYWHYQVLTISYECQEGVDPPFTILVILHLNVPFSCNERCPIYILYK